MKLMLRPEWRLWPLSSFLGLLDLKTGVTVALLIALLNKVAGVYGLIALVTGAGGTFAQTSLYIYSVAALLALAWGLKAVKAEDPKHTLYFAHIFFADHILSTTWTVFFAVVWWIYTPHDGRRQANSEAQKAVMDAGAGHNLSDQEREAAAMAIWDHEKGRAAAIIIISWLLKIYFSLLVYSYATHLRKGSYRSLPRSRAAYQPVPESASNNYDTALGLPEEDEVEDFYRIPLRTPNTGHSISSFADFVSAPGRTRKSNRSSLSNINPGRSGLRSGNSTPTVVDKDVLFDEDETMYSSSSNPHSKVGTDESSSSHVDTDEERNIGYRSESRGRGSSGSSRD